MEQEDEGKMATFSVDRYSGRVVLRRPLDYETKKEYGLVVLASDAAHVARASLTLRVTDENDNAPEFGQPSYSAIIPGILFTHFYLIHI